MTSIDDTPRVDERRGLVPVLVSICAIVAVVSSVGAPLIPTVADTYSVSFTGAQWSLTIAMLTGAVTVPVLGRLGDGPRRRPVVIWALVVVFLGCIFAAIPGNFAMLIIGRGLQGVGLGLMPLAMAVARDHLGPGRARSCVAALSVTAVAGIGFGYPLTGVIAHYFGFHACFVLAAGATLVVLIAAILVVPSSGHLPGHPLDIIGAVTLGVGLTLLLMAISSGGEWGWTSVPLIACAVVGTVVLAAWAVHELRAEHPIVQLRLLRNRSVLTADATGLLAGIGMFILSSSVIRFVQTPVDTGYGLGRSAMIAGLVLVPFSLASVLANKLLPLASGWMPRNLIMPTGALFFVGALVLFLFGRSDLWIVFVAMGIAGLGVGFTFAAMPAFIVSAVPAHETGSALGVNQVTRTVGGAIGSALSATVLAAYTVPGALYPDSDGYSATSLAGIALWILTGLLALGIPYAKRRASRELVDESVDASAAGSFAYEIESSRGAR
ncbi:MFS transporter [Rhodococcus sp. G-MC3]|uniref:MFS transporter n=1 Tax=Rhodococcus sp. G-MC3 TaxID=3046209 RepID=UPI0024B8896E|nr:MFS transporter [Rhodococcus sp. G-MC3]MDJ0392529.1 MFS transporter [Rhodococcus sp. G-MC3]